mmetsp:Transcript_9779/g.16462  ORF Transcript_9779/g.16462 Transcript_9779/m.16462 type:complete len:150 (+) Transcript_9779:36-485(+)|eukprot:CAMPEP_0168590780 /NCGR_PEP_ID=MMETSP0420-20121227/6760_1 /TAXON_ID=498008 /ORGANISM="Pessonella sp." /LENGTH=149 /DNA_ID=CAMNT_0008626481 /DNA_START=476 /DNA_END=925 /DNA_ORIENTATION=+
MATGFICNLASILYPTYATFKAIESTEKGDDAHWLTYWVVVAVFQLVESFTDLLVFWIPFYYTLKLVLFIALQYPPLALPEKLYQQFLGPFFRKHEATLDHHVDKFKTDGVSHLSTLAKSGVEQAKTLANKAQSKAQAAKKDVKSKKAN